MATFVESLLTDTMDVEEKSISRDGSGGTVETWTAKASDVAARVREMGGAQLVMHGESVLLVTHQVLTKYASLENGNRVKTTAGDYLEIRSIQKYPTLYGNEEHWVAMCERVRLT